MSSAHSARAFVIEVIEPELERRLWQRFSSKTRIQVPPWQAATDLFLGTLRENGQRNLRKLSATDAGSSLEGAQWDWFYRVYTGPHEMTLAFPALREDGEKHPWDLILSIRCSIKDSQTSDSRTFLEKAGLESALPGAPLTTAMLASWIGEKIAVRVQDAVSGYSIEYLCGEQGLEDRWWKTQLNEHWLRDYGITVTGAQARWKSAEAAEAEAQRREQEQFERLREEKALFWAAQLKEMELVAKFENEKQLLEADQAHQQALTEHDRRLAAEARAHELRTLEEKYRRQIIEAEAETQKARQSIQEAAVQHLVRMAELQEQLAAAKHDEATHERQRFWEIKNQDKNDQAAFEERQKAIAHDSTIAKLERERQLEQLEREHRQRAAQTVEALRQAERAAERAEEEHRLALAKLRTELEAMQSAQRLLAQARERQSKLNELAAQFEYQEEQERLKHDATLSDLERAQRLAVLKMEYDRQIRQAEAEFQSVQRAEQFAALEHREALLGIEHRIALAEQARWEEIRKREQQAKLNLNQTDLEATEKAAATRRAAEQAGLEHDITMAKLRRELEEVRQAKVHQQEAKREDDERLKHQTEAEKRLAEVGDQRAQLLAMLDDQDPAKAAQAAAWLAHFGISPQDLSALGYSVTPEQLADKLRTKQQSDGNIVTMGNVHFRSRSVGDELRGLDDPDAVEMAARYALTRDAGSGRLATLRIGDPLGFEFATRRSGYVTLLNIGTSGTVFLHVPNAFVGREAAMALANKKYSVPGREFLPGDMIGGYWEGGPRGLERLAIIVSDQPLIPQDWVRRSRPSDPIVTLSKAEVATLYDSLVKWDPGAWTAGVLAFHVS